MKNSNTELQIENLGTSVEKAYNFFLNHKKSQLRFQLLFLGFLKSTGIFYAMIVSYLISSSVEMATLSGFSPTLFANIIVCLLMTIAQFILGSVRGDESLKIGSSLDRSFVELISLISFRSSVSLNPRFITFVKELRIGLTENRPELIALIIGSLGLMSYTIFKNAFLYFLPMPLIFVFFIIWTYRKRKVFVEPWLIQSNVLHRGYIAIEESAREASEPHFDSDKNKTDLKSFFKNKFMAFKIDFITRSLIVLSAIHAAIMLSLNSHPDRIILSTLILFSAKVFQDGVPVWIDLLKVKEIASQLTWSPITQSETPQSEGEFKGEIVFNNLSFRYGAHSPELIKNLSFKLSKGETLVISGASGTGKSTFLKLITGSAKCTSGSISYVGIDNTESWNGLFNSTGYFDQEVIFPDIDIDYLFSWFTAYKDRKDEVLDCVDLNPSSLHTTYHSLSEGERKKVALAVALFHSKSMIILDEPFTGFDQFYAARFSEKLKRLPITKVVTTTTDGPLEWKILPRNVGVLD